MAGSAGGAQRLGGLSFGCMVFKEGLAFSVFYLALQECPVLYVFGHFVGACDGWERVIPQKLRTKRQTYQSDAEKPFCCLPVSCWMSSAGRGWRIRRQGSCFMIGNAPTLTDLPAAGWELCLRDLI